MKGSTWIPFIGLLITLILVFVIQIPGKFLTTPANQLIKYEQKHDNSQMILISLLSSTKNGKTIQQLIGEHLILGEPDKNAIEQILKERLDKLVESKCYKLSTSSKILAKTPKCDPEKYEKTVSIPLPYNPEKLTENLILVID